MTPISREAMAQPKIFSIKSIHFLEINLELWQRKSWIMIKLWKYFNPNSREKLVRFLDSLINLEMELNLLKFLLRKWVLLCQKVYSKKDRWNQVCFHKFYNLSALKMKLFKVTKMEILKAFSWDKCLHTTFKKSFSIKVT